MIDYKAHTISGYFFAFDKAEDPSTSKPGRAYVSEIRNFAYREPIPCRADRGCTFTESCAPKFVPISQAGFNTLRVVAAGEKHTFVLNGANICTFTDATYTNGAIIPYAKVLPPFEERPGLPDRQPEDNPARTSGQGLCRLPPRWIETAPFLTLYG